jgi:hypothetical protein
MQKDGKQQDDKHGAGKQQDGKQQDGNQRVGKQKSGKQEDGNEKDGKEEDGKQQGDKYEMEITTYDKAFEGDVGLFDEDPLPPPPLPQRILPPRSLTGPKRKTTTNQKNNEFVVLCCNIEGLSRNIKRLRNVATGYRPHLILCSETWVTAQNPTQFEIPGYDSAFAPATTSEKGGRPSGGMVEYARSPRWGSLMLQDNDEVGQRVRYATLHVPKLIHIIKSFHIYGPQQASEDKVIASFYNSLTDQISSQNLRSAVIMGDFNAPLTKESLPPTSNAATTDQQALPQNDNIGLQGHCPIHICWAERWNISNRSRPHHQIYQCSLPNHQQSGKATTNYLIPRTATYKYRNEQQPAKCKPRSLQTNKSRIVAAIFQRRPQVDHIREAGHVKNERYRSAHERAAGQLGEPRNSMASCSEDRRLE